MRYPCLALLVAAPLVVTAASAAPPDPPAAPQPQQLPPAGVPSSTLPPPGSLQPPFAPVPPPGSYYPVPMPVPMIVAPRVLDWSPGEQIPPGYRPGTQIRTGLVIAGSVTLGTSWLGSVVVASFGIPHLAVPIVGPFILAGQVAGDSGLAAFWLTFDGLVQAGGAAMLIAGLAARKSVLFRVDVGRAKTWVLPTPMAFGNRGYGLGLVGEM